MARSYARDGAGKFSTGAKGDRAETIQQNKARANATRRKDRDALSGSRLGASGKRKRAKLRSKTVGARATTKRALAVAVRTRKRFG